MPDFPPIVPIDVSEELYKYSGIIFFEDQMWSVAGKYSTEKSGSGLFNYYWWAIELQTGMTAGSYARFYRDFYSHWIPFTWAKKRRLTIHVMFSDYADQYIWLGSGVYPAGASVNTANHVGFKVIDAVLYGTVANGTTESTLDLGIIDTMTEYTLEVVFDPTLPIPEARFYVDKVDKGSITTNLPTGTLMADIAFWGGVYNTAVNNIQLWVEAVRFIQEK